MKKILLGMTAVLSLLACNNSRQNPFLTEWDTPYGIPPFEDILVEDYIPAIEAGIEQQNKEIDSIVNNPEEPTFQNTIAVPTSELLERTTSIFFNLVGANTCDEMDALARKLSPILTEHYARIAHDEKQRRFSG